MQAARQAQQTAELEAAEARSQANDWRARCCALETVLLLAPLPASPANH